MIKKRRCCGAYMKTQGPSMPDYVAATLQTAEATLVVQFKEAYSIEFAGQLRHFTATSQIRLPYSVVYDLIRMRQAPIFILNRSEKEIFYKNYGIAEE